MRRILAVTAITLLATVACKSSGDPDETTDAAASTSEGSVTTTEAPAGNGDDGTGASTTSTASDESPPATVIEDDRAPGVDESTVKIGITYVDFDALGDQVSIDHGDYEAAYRAVIDDINSSGGIHGRTIEPVFAPVDPSSAVSTDEVCTRLTEDEQVFVGVGIFYAESVLCFIDVHETAVIGGEMTEERLAQAKAPWFTMDPSSDQQVDSVQRLLEAGKIDGTIAVGLADTDRPLYENRIAPLLDDAGIAPADIYYFDSGAETEQQQAATDAALARFESSGATTILALGQGGPQVIANGLGRSDYRPLLVFNSINGALAFLRDDTQDHTVLAGSATVGPYDQDAMLDLGGVTGECFDIQRAAGLTLTPPSEVESGEPNQFVSSNTACQQINLLAAILDGAGADLNYGSFWTAGYSLGEIELPSSPEPFHFGPPPSADGDIPLYLYEFDQASEEYVLADDGAS